jgi:hypothetical protein
MANYAFVTFSTEDYPINARDDGLDGATPGELVWGITLHASFVGADIPFTPAGYREHINLYIRVLLNATPNEISRAAADKAIAYADETWGATIPARNVTVTSLQNG